jgi:tetratricopeptide (TPR) repeat protein
MVTVMAAVIVSCGTHRSTATKTPSLTGKNVTAVQTAAGDTLSYNDRRRFDYFYLEAVRQQEAGNYDAAFDLLRHCLTINPRAAEAYYLLAAYYSELEQDSVGLQYLEKAAALSPQNDTYQERVAQYYINTNAYDKAIDAYEKLYANHRDRADVLNILMQLYQQQKNYDGMLSAANRLEQVEGGSEEISLSKMRIYEMKNDKRSAYETLRNLSEQHPNDLNYKIMMGNWLLQNSRKKEAFKIFSDAVKEEPDNTYAQNSLYDFYVAEGQNDMAQQLRDRILLSQKTPSKTLVSLLQEVIKGSEKQSTDSTVVLNLFHQVEDAHPPMPTW